MIGIVLPAHSAKFQHEGGCALITHYSIRLEVFEDIVTTTVRSGAQQHLQEESLDNEYAVLELLLFLLTKNRLVKGILPALFS